MIRCQAVQARLAAFIHGELPLKVRRRVAAHLERCAKCRAAYQRQRELVRELERELPRVGQAESKHLARVWSRVQNELNTPTPRPALRYRTSYGVVALLLLLIVSVPYALSLDDPSPTPARTLPARTVVLATNIPDERVLHRIPENALNRTAPAATRIHVDFVTPQAALTPAPRP